MYAWVLAPSIIITGIIIIIIIIIIINTISIIITQDKLGNLLLILNFGMFVSSIYIAMEHLD